MTKVVQSIVMEAYICCESKDPMLPHESHLVKKCGHPYLLVQRGGKMKVIQLRDVGAYVCDESRDLTLPYESHLVKRCEPTHIHVG